MIKVSIKRVANEEYTEVQNFVTKETPTDKVRQRSGYSESEPLFDREYVAKEIKKQRQVTENLLEQEIQDEANFDFATVVQAINNLL